MKNVVVFPHLYYLFLLPHLPPYEIMLVTNPVPTVRPPSLMLNRSPFSIAMGAINSTSMVLLSPGMIISVPSFNSKLPVMSAVLKKNCGL